MIKFRRSKNKRLWRNVPPLIFSVLGQKRGLKRGLKFLPNKKLTEPQ